ncbi:MAG: sulfatase-like hydrolase/transferase [Clostridia bacterium]|nr:sulfatase-like hydrolase/transferase [Clostridia bacterium]
MSKTKEKYITKHKLIVSLLASLAFSFSFFIFAPLTLFYSEANRSFFEVNNLYDHIMVPYLLFAAAVVFVIGFLGLLVLPKRLHTLAVSVIAWLLVCGYLQMIFFNTWTGGFIAEGNGGVEIPGKGIPNLIMWVVLGAVIVITPQLTFGKIKKVANAAKMVVVYLLVLVFVMQGAGLFEAVLTSPEETRNTKVLSYDNIFNVSKNHNIIVFLLDKFDIKYYEELKEYDPEFFEEFDGFTAYTDHMSMYAKTYPSVAYMLTGVEQDYENGKDEYFRKAYSETTALPALKEMGYNINLYVDDYYVYSDAGVMEGYVDNVVTFDGDTKMAQPKIFYKHIVRYGLYVYSPDIFKKKINISSSNFTSCATNNVTYKVNDSSLYRRFVQDEGLNLNDNNNFTFIHMRGCHNPFCMDENCNYVGNGNATSLQQTRGVFKFIKEYIADMKSKGIYENATIIITGDHSDKAVDSAALDAPAITALMVKERGEAGFPMKESKAQLCHDNFLPSVLKSAGIENYLNYGKAYSDIKENEDVVRRYSLQRLLLEDYDETIEYRVEGDGTDFNNWKIVDRFDVMYR